MSYDSAPSRARELIPPVAESVGGDSCQLSPSAGITLIQSSAPFLKVDIPIITIFY